MLEGARKWGAAFGAVALAVVVAACGGGGGGKSNSGSSGGGTPATGAKKGGTIKIGTIGPDSYDPIEFTTVQGNSALQLVYKGLLTYKDVTGPAGQDLVPAVADSVPTPTNGGKTYKFHIRPGLKYSDGEPVRASDFENMIKRQLYLGGPWSSFIFPVKGAEQYASAHKKNGTISGLVVSDSANTITLHLTKPDTRVLYALAITNYGMTPKSKSPFKVVTGNNAPPGIGPYTVHVDNPSPTNGQFTLTKNPSFNIPGLAKGNLDKIVGMVSTNVNKMTQDVISGALDYMTEDPVGDLLPQVEQKYKDRFLMQQGYPNTYYFFMNYTTPPFNKLAARQAVNYAIDSRALVRVFGGRMKPSCNFLPPAMAGYKPIQPCPWGDPNGPGNVTKAKQLVQQAGLAGSKVTVWTNSKDPRPAIADYLRGVLNQIGFKASIRTLNQTVYFSTIGNPKTKAQIGFTDWYQDFPHPGDFFGQLLTTAAAKANPSNNQGFVSDPHIDQQVEQLDAKPPKDVAAGWAALDKYVNDPQHAYVAVYGNEILTAFYSTRMNIQSCSGYPHPTYRADWALFCLK